MAAEKPNRGRSAHQDQRLYTIRPLRWKRSELLRGCQYAACAVGTYYTRETSSGWRVSLEFASTLVAVTRSATLAGAKVAAESDLHRRLKYSLKPAGKAVRCG